MELITLHLTPQECLLFKLFQEHYDDFRILADAGLFSVKQGSVNVHFDTAGNIGTIDIHHNTYRRRLADRLDV